METIRLLGWRLRRAAEPKYGIVKAVYLGAIGIATIGWLWLIAWCAWELI
jgi:hypothetical protein